MQIRDLYENVRDGKIISDIELQREIVYNDEKQRLVIDSLVRGIPLPAFYFWENDNGILEVLDGKQRIYAIQRFIENDIMYDNLLWKQTATEIQDIINNRELSIIVCKGSEELKREIFRRINTLGVPLSKYEVLNGLFNGEYLRGLTAYIENDKDAKRVLGTNSRGRNQYTILELLTSLKQFTSINDYVKNNKSESFETDQREIGKYIRFISEVFDKYDELKTKFALALKYYKNFALWKEYRKEINSRIAKYLKSDDAKLTDKPVEIENIILAVVNNIVVDDKRLFSRDDKLELLRQRKIMNNKYQCDNCGKYFLVDELQVDHKDPWSKGGRTVLSNAQLLCEACNKHKGNK